MTYEELAATAKVPLATLKSVVRMAICMGFLSEDSPGVVSHSRVSAHFRENAALQDWAVFMAEATLPMALKLYEATEKFGTTQNKTETAFNLAMNTNLPFFDYLNQSPHLTKQFAGYMKSVTSTQGTAIKHLVEGFDWAGLGAAKVVDVS
jgi:6-hydroxytryprostatin B O-methyltransferase